MTSGLAVRDDTLSGATTRRLSLSFPSERITVRELIRERVYPEAVDVALATPTRAGARSRPGRAGAARDRTKGNPTCSCALATSASRSRARRARASASGATAPDGFRKNDRRIALAVTPSPVRGRSARAIARDARRFPEEPPMIPRLLAPLALCALAPLARAQCLTWDGGIPPGVGGPNGAIRDVLVWDDGTGPALYACGEFTSIGGSAANRIARWDGTSWTPLGTGLEGGSSPACRRMIPWTIAGEPVLVVGGNFASAGGNPALDVAVWDGSGWSPLGAGFATGLVWDLELYDAGSGPELYACGTFVSSASTTVNRIARWDGTQWQPLGQGITVGPGDVWQPSAYTLEVFDPGTGPLLYVAGAFQYAGGQQVGCIAGWDGATWSTPGTIEWTQWPGEGVYDLEVFDDGTGPRLFVCGLFGIPNSTGTGWSLHRLVAWDGTGYELFNNGSAHPLFGFPVAMDVFDDGTGPALYLGGWIDIGGGPSASGVAKWDGFRFTSLGAGVSPDTGVRRVATLPDLAGGPDDLWAVGALTEAGGAPVANFARWSGCDGPGEMFCFGDAASATPCPCANAGAYVHGCDNSAGTGGALLSASGTTSPDTVTLHAQDELATSLTVFLQGDAIGAPIAFGDGLRCAAGVLKRLYVKNAVGGFASAPTGGEPSILVRSAELGDPIAPGSTRVYQTYYRDPFLEFCPAGSGGGTWNASNAVRIDW